jgi:hypothetical protein
MDEPGYVDRAGHCSTELIATGVCHSSRNRHRGCECLTCVTCSMDTHTSPDSVQGSSPTSSPAHSQQARPSGWPIPCHTRRLTSLPMRCATPSSVTFATLVLLQRLKAHFEAIVRKDFHGQGPYQTYVLSMFSKRVDPAESVQPLTSRTSLIPSFGYRPPNLRHRRSPSSNCTTSTCHYRRPVAREQPTRQVRPTRRRHQRSCHPRRPPRHRQAWPRPSL